ncbi:hypothetical protein GOODEAATRI_025991 [Goodea atripinnis]|uniref:Uncharacterized protein n=1 Tax=Goodea atripinnis TaxID=208336 RepID=A0ABV0Q149_9TELE
MNTWKQPSESFSCHRWRKYNRGIGSPKVASGPCVSEVFGFLLLDMTICHITLPHSGERKYSSNFLLNSPSGNECLFDVADFHD